MRKILKLSDKPTAGQSSIQKYYFALGFHHRMCDRNEPPNQKVIDYHVENHNINPIEEYNKGRKIAERDIVNGYK